MERGHSEVAVSGHNLLKDRIIEVYLKDPSIARTDLADITGASYGFTRKVVSQYVRKQVTSRREPSGLPFSVHGWFWGGLWKDDVYVKCPGIVVSNRNGMKRFLGRSFTFLLHKNGRVSVCPFVDDERVWRNELVAWLKGWVGNDGLAEALLKEANLQLVGSKSYAVHAPGIVRKLNFKVKGFGSFKTDSTPYKDGTAEVEVDPKFESRLGNIEARLDRLDGNLERLVGSLERFSDKLDLLLNPPEVLKPLKDDYSR